MTRLCKEILGPRNGLRERLVGLNGNLPPDPSDEYVVGVLEPKGIKRSALAYFGRPAFIGNQDIKRMEDSEKLLDEEEDCDCETVPAEITPELDPRALPKSLGLSFVVNGEGGLGFSFCATWARYKKAEGCWERQPFFFLKKELQLNADSTWKSESDPGVTLQLRQRKVSNGIHVSLFLVNSTPSSSQYPQVEELIFQPQIRVVCNKNTSVVPIRSEETTEGDVDGLNLLYKERYAKARGHLCGAVWDEVDPERPLPSKEAEEAGPPFSWVDGELLEQTDRQMFTCSNVRTEYLPCYSIEQAMLTGPAEENLAAVPAELLANAWDSDKLNAVLKPILDAYEKWIETKKKIAADFTEKEKEQASKQLEACNNSLKRMKEGLALLNADSDVRLAFCFMNQAMHKQSLWKNPANPLKWHLFQIAFILQCIAGISIEGHPDRSLCDLLWFPTGAGKTEAYLGLASFAIALRKRREPNGAKQAGIVVLSRYTLRLLTIQQFRRALSMITACEYLRVSSWLPKGHQKEILPWGTARISIGLWVGAGVTPNHLIDFKGFDVNRQRPVLYLGAIGELYGRHRLRDTKAIRIEGEESEPAQVLYCPVCQSILAVSSTTLTEGEWEIHWIVSSKTQGHVPDISRLPPYRGLRVDNVRFSRLPNGSSVIVTVEFTVSPRSEITPEIVDMWWQEIIKPAIDPDLTEEFTRPSRPGYFYRRSGFSQQPTDFEIHCPNIACELNKIQYSEHIVTKEETLSTKPIYPFRIPEHPEIGWGITIPAYTVDDQIYGRCPSMVVATVDKFARLSFEPRASALFGYVTHYDSEWGYYRANILPYIGDFRMGRSYNVEKFDPPSLIIQDELHLIEGPLGTMVGLYETGIEILATKFRNDKAIGPKYVASTATIKQADSQVKALFDRKLAQFPPIGLRVDDSFFAIAREPHQLESIQPGRLYLGICAPGRGAQTPIIRIWSLILKEMAQIRKSRGYNRETDQFSTIVGYFNAKRELAGALGLYKQDIPERLGVLAKRGGLGPCEPRDYIELSGRTESVDIPGKLDRLAKFPNNDTDALFCTSMFGTGVDVDRLGLMIVHGQPKTTANYIQATGRVGRKMGGLVVTFLRSTRPRDLDHYEFFIGYHRSLHRYVEPITVFPFSPRARERGLGPLSVLVLRNAHVVSGILVPTAWAPEERAIKKAPLISGSRLMGARRRSPEIVAIVNAIEERCLNQPEGRSAEKEVCKREVAAELDRWEAFALLNPKELVYSEITMTREPLLPVVLGDPSHDQKKLPQVYKNAPQSLREVEATTTFDDEA